MSGANDKTARRIVKQSRDAIIRDYLVRNWTTIESRAWDRAAKKPVLERLGIAWRVVRGKNGLSRKNREPGVQRHYDDGNAQAPATPEADTGRAGDFAGGKTCQKIANCGKKG